MTSSASRAPPRIEPITFATYNTGLARGYIADAGARATKIADAIANEEIDVLCLQEVWTDEDWQRIAQKARVRMPHVLRGAPRPIVDRCAPTERGSLQSCSATCSRVALPVRCAVERCTSPSTLSPECVRCVAASLVTGSSPEACVTTTPRSATPGTTLFSRWPLLSAGEEALNAPWLPRSVLHARLGGLTREVRVLCTHLPVPFGSSADSSPAWTEVQLRALETLARLSAGRGFTVLLGDFNVGPATAEARSFFPELYAELIGSGFRNPYAERTDASCSRCDDNPLVGQGFSGGVLIDHILLRNAPGNATAARLWVDPVVLAAHDGGTREGPLSDHYGIRVTVELEK